MKGLKRYTNFLWLLIAFAFYACSSDNTPVAENFIGDWEIYEKVENGTATEDITGELLIKFGTDLIEFGLSIDAEDAEESLNLSGIVVDDVLYDNVEKKTNLGRLKLNEDVLSITLKQIEGTVFYARK